MENEEYLKTKFDNMFVKILSAVMFDEINKVKHFMSDEVYDIFNNKLIELNGKNERQMYDELNVKSSELVKSYEDDNYNYIDVKLVSRYMDYVINKDTGKYLRGNNKSRIEKVYYLTFSKRKDVKEQGVVKKCSNCGAGIDVNNSGICPYCKKTYNLEKYDYILCKINY